MELEPLNVQFRRPSNGATQSAVSTLPPSNTKEPHVFTAHDKSKCENNLHESYPRTQTFTPTFHPLSGRPEQDPSEQTALPQSCSRPGAVYFPPTPVDHHQHPQYNGSHSSTLANLAHIDVIPRRKAPRASLACEGCRQQKAKCNEGRPCRNCKDRDQKCVYPDIPVKITQDVRSLLVETKKTVDRKFDKMEELLRSLGASDKPPNVAISGVESEPSEQAARIQPLTLNHIPRTSLLLNWPSIQMLTADLLKAEGILSINEFPISIMEQQPDIFRVFGHDRSSQNPKFDRCKVKSYTQSFKEHILNMHPIIIPGDLDSMVEAFLDSRPKAATTQPVTFLPLQASRKRKFPSTTDHHNHHATSEEPGLPQQSINEAVVLLVLALGKICVHSRAIPDAMSEDRYLPSPIENEEAIPTAKDAPYGESFNAIPGLEYFALATKIIGSQVGSCSLEHANAQILAGLYCGQLGRVLDSSFYISWASRTIQIILAPAQNRPSKDEYAISSRRENQLALTFWTCLQLENDILAELPLPPSGILQYEDKMPYPDSKMMTDQGVDDSVITSCLAQLFLRKQLNKIYTIFYSQNRRENDYSTVEKVVEDIQTGLKASRSAWVPPLYHWNDGDPPTGDILAARLRAKYWDSQVILYRPFLENVLHQDQLQTPMGWASPDGDITLNNACLAIQALIESTRAFHRLEGKQRLIIANIFETAHSRWGNLLILAACYKDRLLCKYVDEDILKDLFAQTVDFLGTSDHLFNNTLRKERNVLVGLAKNLGFISSYV
ncbi:hypothetical protein F4678DRAFT_223723 [Xylaria arbuscula]|nr:hypothetical protein F4678DRAFT_223723 [Xylaria arbuscula]